MSAKITILKQADAPALRDIRGLLSQIRSYPSENTGTMSELRNLIGDKNIVVVIAKDGARIIGMALLYINVRIGRRIGQVEEVVVDSEHRGKGLGKSIMQKLIATARKKRLEKLYLTSRPSRVAANALYERLGFEKKETNVYQFKI